MEQINCGIYKITNQVNGKVYIGQSKNIHRRWLKHKNVAKIIAQMLSYIRQYMNLELTILILKLLKNVHRNF